MKKYDGGTESALSGCADMAILVSWAVFFIGVAGGITGFTTGSLKLGWLSLIFGPTISSVCIVVARLLQGSAEQIRLLKRLNCLNYAGEIKPVTYFDPVTRKPIIVEAELVSRT